MDRQIPRVDPEACPTLSDARPRTSMRLCGLWNNALLSRVVEFCGGDLHKTCVPFEIPNRNWHGTVTIYK